MKKLLVIALVASGSLCAMDPDFKEIIQATPEQLRVLERRQILQTKSNLEFLNYQHRVFGELRWFSEYRQRRCSWNHTGLKKDLFKELDPNKREELVRENIQEPDKQLSSCSTECGQNAVDQEFRK